MTEAMQQHLTEGVWAIVTQAERIAEAAEAGVRTLNRIAEYQRQQGERVSRTGGMTPSEILKMRDL